MKAFNLTTNMQSFSTLSAFAPVLASSVLSNSTLGQNTLYFQGFDVYNPVNAYRVNFYLSVGTTTSATNLSLSAAFTMSACLYTRGTGTQSNQINSFWSGSFYVGASMTSQSAMTFAYPQGIANSTSASMVTTTFATSDASTYMNSTIGGFRVVPLPVSLTLNPGRYFMAVAYSQTADTSATFNVAASILQQTNANNIAFRPFGVNSAASNASFYGLQAGAGTYSATSGGFPSTIPLSTSAIKQGPTLTLPFFDFSGFNAVTNQL